MSYSPTENEVLLDDLEYLYRQYDILTGREDWFLRRMIEGLCKRLGWSYGEPK